MDIAHIARSFPLVARSHPPCPPLDVRIAEIADLTRAAEGPDGAPALRAAAHNKAALIASDAGLPGLARDLCWYHHLSYAPCTRPWTAQHARLALEPLVNLARLHIRDGHPSAAVDLLDALYRGARTGTDTLIDGRLVLFADLTSTPHDHQEVCRWLWSVLLADGLRALTTAGGWDQALAHAQRHRGVGRRLLDGRQTAILARLSSGSLTDAAVAAEMLDDAVIIEPWEHVVAAALRVLVQSAAHRSADDDALLDLVDQYLNFHTPPTRTVFSTRLGLAVVDLADAAAHPCSVRAAGHLIRHAITTGDGYAARDVLAHPIHDHLPPREAASLTSTRAAAGLDGSAAASDLQHRLDLALRPERPPVPTRG
ncbi:MAG: hypothetical protein ACRDRZ_08030 [Pseudonocardiaceae bacterium]